MELHLIEYLIYFSLALICIMFLAYLRLEKRVEYLEENKIVVIDFKDIIKDNYTITKKDEKKEKTKIVYDQKASI